jgi:hypothetical protein
MAQDGHIADLTGNNMNLLMGNYLDGLSWTILDSDGDPFDFSSAVGGDGFYLRIYNKKTKTRELIATLSETGGDLVEAEGVITLNADFPSGMIYYGRYEYEIDYKDTEGLKRVAEGIFKVK